MDTERLVLAHCWSCNTALFAGPGIALRAGELYLRPIDEGDWLLCGTCHAPGVYEKGQIRRPNEKEILGIAMALVPIMDAN